MVDSRISDQKLADETATDQPGDVGLIRQVVAQLNAQQNELDGATLSRLNQGRQDALNEYDRRSSWRGRWSISPATGLGTAAVLTLALGLGWWQGPATNFQPTNSADMLLAAGLVDLELLAAIDEPEMFADLDFYYWVGMGSDLEIDSDATERLETPVLPSAPLQAAPAAAG